MVYGDALVTRTEGVLHEGTEVVWQWHVLGRCADTADGYERTVVGASRRFDAMWGQRGSDHRDIEA